MTHTYTFVVLEVTQSTFNEIQNKLQIAEYDHCFSKVDGKVTIDMQGIALQVEDKK